MQNQAAVEALYSATFVEDYLDCVENLPNDLQRHLSRLREFDLTQYTEFLKDLGSLVSAFEKETTASGQRAILAKIQHGLIAAQDIGDDKLATVQAMSDLIENKTRQLEHDSKNLDFGTEEEEESNSTVQPASTTPAQSTKNTSVPKSTKRQAHAEDKADKLQVKRRKKLHEKKEDRGNGSAPTEDDEAGPSTTTKSATANTKGRGAAINSAKKTSSNTSSSAAPAPTKRKQSKRAAAAVAANVVDKDDSDHEVDIRDLEIDPDEPTYCLCDQISYGEMIGCDNDLCPIEWFHFSCVQLTNKPKGKWFCPKCRGDKPTTMKPKAQFLKELEKYNKEREEKMTKQSG